jgi:hypothetical protein
VSCVHELGVRDDDDLTDPTNMPPSRSQTSITPPTQRGIRKRTLLTKNRMLPVKPIHMCIRGKFMDEELNILPFRPCHPRMCTGWRCGVTLNY